MSSVYEVAWHCLMAGSIEDKLERTISGAQQWRQGLLSCQDNREPQAVAAPGRPERPSLVAPGQVPHRGLFSVEGRAALIHAIAHIEFNAIDLAWDAVYRFRDHPQSFIDDWVKVADEEASHFQLLRQRLQSLGYDYGDFAAHNGLWEMAVKTDFDPMVRMALVPRVLEARGLDVTPGMIKRLQGAGDHETTAILEIILRDEIGHVRIGSRWFAYHCEQRGLDMSQTFRDLIRRYFSGGLRGPFHHEARQQAGFSAQELEQLEQMLAQSHG